MKSIQYDDLHDLNWPKRRKLIDIDKGIVENIWPNARRLFDDIFDHSKAQIVEEMFVEDDF